MPPVLDSVVAGVIALGLAAAPLRAQCPDGTPPPCAGARVAPTSVAVLYFDNLSRDTSDAYLADGLTEELISRLDQIERLQVKSRAAVQRFRGRRLEDPGVLGRTLGVAHLVSGSVRRGGGRLRVTVELTRATTGVSLWGRTFDRPATDVLGVEAEIAESVAVSVGGRLAPAERQRLEARPTVNAAAYDHFLRGNFERARRTTTGILRAIQEYETAAHLDPHFAPPLAYAVQSYSWLARLYYGPEVRMPRESLMARSRALLDRALRLDSTSSEAWMARATGSWPDAAAMRDALTHAVALSPRNAEAHHQLGLILRYLGEDSAAATEFRRALALEPDRAITLDNLGVLFVVGRRFTEAQRWIDSAVALRPDAAFYYLEQALVRLQLSDTAGARSAADMVGAHGDANGREEILAMIQARAGDSAGARSRLAHVDSAMRGSDCFVSFPCLGLSQALSIVGARDAALSLFERNRPRDAVLWYWSKRAEYDPLRDDPRFRRVVEESRPPGVR